MNVFDEKSKEYKRELIHEILVQCTEEQKKFFNRMYGSIETIPEDKMKHAYSQCERTLLKNLDGQLNGKVLFQLNNLLTWGYKQEWQVRFLHRQLKKEGNKKEVLV